MRNITFYLLEILKNHSCAVNPLKTKDLCCILKNDYGIRCDHRTARNALCSLISLGYPIKYSETQKNNCVLKSDWYLSSDFSESDNLLITATITASPFLSEEQKIAVRKKLGVNNIGTDFADFTHIHFESSIALQEKLDVLKNCMERHLMVSFAVIEYIKDETAVLSQTCGSIKRYLAKPLKLLLYPDTVFLFCEMGDTENYRYFDISCLYDIAPTKNEFYADNTLTTPIPLNIAEKETMEVFGREKAVVAIDRSRLSSLIKMFGSLAKIRFLTDQIAQVEIFCNFSLLKEKILSFGSAIEVLSPTKLRRGVALELQNAAGKYREIRRLRGYIEPQ